jgi:N6-L-threonylcarbamoyladenine synthase
MSKILAIDTSCDDSSAAVVDGTAVLSNIVASQAQIHKAYGGVFPTLAKQAHKENLPAAVHAALVRARVDWPEIAAIAVTVGPGLAPALEVGIAYAKDLSALHRKPLIGVNHIEAHALSPLARVKTNNLDKSIKFPVLAIVISGGHSEFILIEKIGQYRKLGRTIDDAAGECLDKVGRLLNLGYPAGPLLEKFAKQGQCGRFVFPKAMLGQSNFDLSYSGLKTAARTLIQKLEEENKLNKQSIFDFACDLQRAVFDQITYKLERILLSPDLDQAVYPSRHFLKHLTAANTPVSPINEIWLGGGVAANIALRQALRATLRKYAKQSGKKIPLRVPYHKRLCGDNAAMIGLVASFKSTDGNSNLERQPNLSI